jgi:para-nitrobenzyl esterase
MKAHFSYETDANESRYDRLQLESRTGYRVMIKRRQFLLGGCLVAAAVRSNVSARTSAPVSPDPIVSTRGGAVRGRLVEGLRVFTGIPFGAPPVGPLRFAPPRPAAPWTGVMNATRPAATPAQNIDPALPPAAPISEDCLQLNVWSPSGPGPFPVLVWIFGGGNQTGASNLPAYQGDTFARDGVVFVSLNYRVGVFGFLELGGILGADGAGSANNASRDQLLALEWVRDNIAAFGGDPGNVTIAGQSAGGWNVATLLAVPAAEGLFHRAIIASGNAAATYSRERAEEFARLFVGHLGGAARLRTAPVEQLLEAQQAAAAEFPSLIPFRPVIDGGFLPAQPIDRIKTGATRKIPILVGHTRDEYRYFASAAQLDGRIRANQLVNADPAALAPVIAAYHDAFPGRTDGEIELEVLSDEIFDIPAVRIAEAQSAAGGTAYLFELRYPIEHGPFGAATPHGIDVPLIFDKLDTAFARNVFGYARQDEPMARRVHATWISFVRDGTARVDALRWPAYDSKRRATMIVAREPSVADDLDGMERRIWEGAG